MAQQDLKPAASGAYTGDGTDSNNARVQANFDEIYAVDGPLADAVTAAETAQGLAETAQGLAETAQAAAEAAVSNAGIIPLATIDLSTNPTTGDSLLIGATTIEFKAAGENVGADENVAVLIGVDAATTFASLLAALNGTAANPHASILLKAPSTDPAVGVSAEIILADDAAALLLRVVPATAPGGTAVPGPQALALADSLTAAVNWSVTNLNKTLGVAAGTPQMAFGSYTITAGESEAVFQPPFTPTFLLVQVQTSAGVTKVSGTGSMVIEGDHLLITKGDLDAGDVVSFVAYG